MIVCCGEALVDMVPEGEEGLRFTARPGGCPYNSAIAAARLGAQVRFVGRMGSDFLGDFLLAGLAANGVDARHVARIDQPATLAFVKRERDGSARYAFYSNGAADRSLTLEDIPSELPPAASFLLVGSISLAQEPSGSSIEALVEREWRRRLVSLDPNARPGLFGDDGTWRARLLRLATRAAIVRLSDEDLRWLIPGPGEEEAVADLLALGPELVVLTRGASGAKAYRRGRPPLESKSRRVEVVDTIGAGDTFHAALLVTLDALGIHDRPALVSLPDETLSRALDRANAAAALDCLRVGADPPRSDELEAFLGGRE